MLFESPGPRHVESGMTPPAPPSVQEALLPEPDTDLHFPGQGPSRPRALPAGRRPTAQLPPPVRLSNPPLPCVLDAGSSTTHSGEISKNKATNEGNPVTPGGGRCPRRGKEARRWAGRRPSAGWAPAALEGTASTGPRWASKSTRKKREPGRANVQAAQAAGRARTRPLRCPGPGLVWPGHPRGPAALPPWPHAGAGQDPPPGWARD